jgi:protein-disulfide isomerase
MSGRSTVPAGRDAKLAAIRKQNEADRRRSRLVAIVTGVVVLSLVAVVGVVIALSARDRAEQNGADPLGVVAVGGSQGNGTVDGVAVGPDDAAVTVTIAEDFICPICGRFEEVSGEYVRSLPGQGVRVVYAPVAILDRQSKGTRYSTRAAAAAACVAESDARDTSPSAEASFPRFHSLLFANQPDEGTEGLTDEQLAGYAAQAGADGTAQQCIRDATFTGWAGRNTKAALDAGLTGTPTVWVNGTKVDNPTPENIGAAVTAAAG